MTDSYEAMKSQKEVILARDNEFLHKRRGELVIERDRARAELTRIYDILAGINDAVEIGDDGYARFGSVNDADRLRALVGELEPAALADHGKRAEVDLANVHDGKGSS